jgi:hypothetical protein
LAAGACARRGEAGIECTADLLGVVTVGAGVGLLFRDP